MISMKKSPVAAVIYFEGALASAALSTRNVAIRLKAFVKFGRCIPMPPKPRANEWMPICRNVDFITKLVISLMPISKCHFDSQR